LLGNFIPWVIADYWTKWKDITRISPTSWRENIGEGTVWDDNHFHINGLLHPYQGSFYYLAGRSNNYSFEKSFLFTLLGSAFWECCGESHLPSTSDLFTTTLGGTAIGEVLFRFGSDVLADEKWYSEPLGFVLSPTRAGTRWMLGQRRHPTGQALLIQQLPRSLDAHAALGTAFSQANVLLEIGATYNTFDQVQVGARPFNHYLAAIEWGLGGKRYIGRAHVRGALWPLVVGETEALRYAVVPVQGLDFINRRGYEFGGPSLGLAGAARWRDVIVSVDGHGLFAGIESKYAKYGKPHDPREKERDREYDFTVGGGFGATLSADPWPWLRVSGFAQKNFLRTLHGSNVDGYGSWHEAGLYGFTVLLPKLIGRLGLGGDGRFFRSMGHYGNPAFMSEEDLTEATERRRVTEWRLYATWHFAGTPLSMFVF
jgi:hypothetical protein